MDRYISGDMIRRANHVLNIYKPDCISTDPKDVIYIRNNVMKILNYGHSACFVDLEKRCMSFLVVPAKAPFGYGASIQQLYVLFRVVDKFLGSKVRYPDPKNIEIINHRRH